MNRVIASAVAVFIMFAISGCDDGAKSSDLESGAQSGSGIGFMITPNGGRIGIDLGGGLFINPATGQVGLGFPA